MNTVDVEMRGHRGNEARLTDEMFAAMAAHRSAYAKANPKRCRTERATERHWREHLTNAWLNDWREQWGLLRTVRNTVGIQEAFTQFGAMRQGRCVAEVTP
jgi:hypothetical protein